MAKVAHDVCTKVTLFNSMNLCTRTLHLHLLLRFTCTHTLHMTWHVRVRLCVGSNHACLWQVKWQSQFFSTDFFVRCFAIEHSTFLHYKYQWIRSVNALIWVDRHFDFQLNHDDWCDCVFRTSNFYSAIVCVHAMHSRQPFSLVRVHKINKFKMDMKSNDTQSGTAENLMHCN